MVACGVGCVARERNEFNWFGCPRGVYFAAQGVFFCYLGIVVYYNRRMQSLDAVHTVPSGQGGE